jgi:hypothetical protein
MPNDCFYCLLELFAAPSMAGHCSLTMNKAGILKIKRQRYMETSVYFLQSRNTLKRKDAQLDQTLESKSGGGSWTEMTCFVSLSENIKSANESRL